MEDLWYKILGAGDVLSSATNEAKSGFAEGLECERRLTAW
jgi:hypothetical protein